MVYGSLKCIYSFTFLLNAFTLYDSNHKIKSGKYFSFLDFFFLTNIEEEILGN